MKNTYFLMGALVIALIVTGILYLANLKTPPKSDASAPHQKGDFLAAKPDFGPLIPIQQITVTYEGDKALGVLPANIAKEIKLNNKVVLYDKEGYTLPLGGTVSEVISDEENASVTIDLPPQTNTNLLFNELDIIIFESFASERLPKSAYITDESGEPYVWKAHPSQDNKGKYYLEKLSIKMGMSDENYFEENGHVIQSKDFIILNPNDKITADTLYNLDIVDLNAPLHNPIKQAWVDFELSRLDTQQKELREKAAQCKAGNADASAEANIGAAPLPDNPTSANNSCGSGVVGTSTDPMKIFKALTNTK